MLFEKNSIRIKAERIEIVKRIFFECFAISKMAQLEKALMQSFQVGTRL